MIQKLFRSTTLRALVIIYVMIAASFVFVGQANSASAASTRSTLVIGIQNDMVNMNPWDPGTNSVWKAYQTEWGLEALFGQDPDFAIFPYLADPAQGGASCPSGSLPSNPGYCVDASGLNVTVFIRQGASGVPKFWDGTTTTPLDVVFTFQSLAWSTAENGIYQALWWDVPRVHLWKYYVDSTNTSMSHIGVEPGASGTNSVIFHLARPYALFFYDTMLTGIIPENVWANHLQGGHPLNLTTATPLTDTWDRSIDFGYGIAGQYAAAMGTGPFMVTNWVHNSNASVVVNPAYWGLNIANAAHTWRGVSYPFFPKALKDIEFKVYGSLDVVSLALQKGEIDTLLWSLTPGFLNQVRSNPAIGVATSTDSGYFYMAFNMRKAPWNDLCLRQAISMAIDKSYIVNTLLGGFGLAGTVPIGQTNSLYVNTSASPPTFDLAGAATKLDGCGYHVNPATGFRTTPSGAPIAASILSPPKDYDPVRASAAIMISNNLKSIGLDLDAAPTSFDTIVTKAFTQPVSFDIYILGWSLGDFPETYLCNFFCANQDPNINPAGSNSPGYVNPRVDQLLAQAAVTVDTTTRVSIIKHVEGILANDIPWNVLYYRKNINAFRTDTWEGWIPVSGGGSGNLGIYNFWSLMALQPAGTPTSSGSTGSLQIGLTVPDQVFARQTVPMDVFVAQNQAPAAGASVAVNISYGSVFNETTYTTDGSGHVHLSWTVPVIQGNVIVAVQATQGTAQGTNTKIMEVSIGPPMPIGHLTLSTTTPVISPGATATVTASVTDGAGAPIAGVPVRIDRTLMLGSISPTSGTTTSAGTVTFTYTAPAASSWPVPNGHVVDYIVANTTVPNTIVGTVQAYQLTMYIQNDAPPNWFVVNTTAPTLGFTVDPVTSSITIPVQVHRFDGSLVGAGFQVDAIASETNGTLNNVTVTPSATTDASGLASFTVTETADAIAAQNNTNVFIRFQVHNAANTTSDEIQLLVWGGATTSRIGYSARVSFTARAMPYEPTFAENNATVTVWDQLGAPVSGVPVFFQIDYGPLGVPAQFPYVYDYATPEYSPTTGRGAGLDMNAAGGGSLGGVFQNSTGPQGLASTTYQGAAYGVENWFNDFEIENDFNNFATGTAIDSCDPSTWPATGFDGRYFFNATSVTDTAGQYTAAFYGLPIRLDSEIQVRAFITNAGSTDAAQAISNLWASGGCNFGFQYDHATRIDSGVVSQRAPMFGLGWVKTYVPKTTITPGGPVPTNTPSSTPAYFWSSRQPAVTLVAKFYALDGADPGPVQVILAAGVGSATRSVLGTGGSLYCFGQCALTTNSHGYLNRTYTSQVFSLSQSLEFTWVDADPVYAGGAREQLFSGCTAPCADASAGNEFGDFWLTPTFTALLNKVSITADFPYMYFPTSTAFMTIQTSNALLSLGQSTTATVKVWSILTGQPIAGASVWSGNTTVFTDATGTATFNVTATQLGVVETLAVASTDYGGSARAWYSYIASLPVVTFSTPTVTAGTAGTNSTITVTVTNTLPVSGTITVWLYVNGQPVMSKQVTLASGGTATVSFSYAFANAGTYNVAVGTSSPTNVSSPASVTVGGGQGPSGFDPVIAYALAGGLLVLGLVLGVVLGLLMGRRRRPPTVVAETAEERREDRKLAAEDRKAAEEELGPDEQL